MRAFHPLAVLFSVAFTAALSGCGGGDVPDAGSGEGDPEVQAPAAPAALLESVQGLVTAGLGTSQVEANADILLDSIGPRISALESGEQAQAFALDRFRTYGLENAGLDPFPLLGWDRQSASLQAFTPRSPNPVTFPVLSLGHVGSYRVEAGLLDAGFGTAEEIAALGEQVRGSIVLVSVTSPPDYGRSVHRTEKVTLATRAGAVGFIQMNERAGPLIPVGVATIGDEETSIPAVAVDNASGTQLRDWLAGGDPVSIELEVENWMERTEAGNVLGEITGETDEVILVGGHLDSWDLATGALDNGSGSLAVLEAARLLAEHVARTGQRPRRTIRFALWMGEELGLYGSRDYARRLQESGDMAQVRAVLNLDVVGDPTGLGAMGRPEVRDFLRSVAASVSAGGIPLEEEISSGGGLYSDHQPFLLQGVPIVSIQSRNPPSAAGVGHTADDVRDHIDEPGIGRSGVTAAALLWTLANVDSFPMAHWQEVRIGEVLTELGLRDPLERGGEWRW
ncbi:MAG: M28 family peptidase [Gemmatimonadota bacterium]